MAEHEGFTPGRADAFSLGFVFRARLDQGVFDARDVARVMTCNDFPPEWRELGRALPILTSKDEGVAAAVQLIRKWFDETDADAPRLLAENARLTKDRNALLDLVRTIRDCLPQALVDGRISGGMHDTLLATIDSALSAAGEEG